MLDLYIVDYLSKRGFSASAQSLVNESNLQETKVPIDARQGLLYEWWTVFWELFSARHNDDGARDAKVYVQVRPRVAMWLMSSWARTGWSWDPWDLDIDTSLLPWWQGHNQDRGRDRSQETRISRNVYHRVS